MTRGVPLVNVLILDNLCEYRHELDFWTTYLSKSLGLSFSHFDVIGPKSIEFDRMQNNGHYAI